jgi:hypothetical protein
MDDVETKLLKRERPGGRILTLGGESVACTLPIILTEFGGIAFGGAEDVSWGYSRSRTNDQLVEQYRALLKSVRSASALAGFCYTQFTDTYQEVNGLLYADRTPKMPIEVIAQATSGLLSGYDAQADTAWNQPLMQP